MSLTSFRLSRAWDWGGLSAKQLAVQTYKEVDKDEILDRAAVVAFYAMLALVPFLGFILAITATAGAGGLASQLLSIAGQVLPAEALTIVQDQIHKIQSSPPTGVLSFSFIILVWSASGLFVAVMDAVNAAYGIHDERPWWKRRLMAILLTVIEAILLIGALVSIVAWPQIMSWFKLQGVATTIATIVQWTVVIVALFVSFAIAYYFAPHAEQKWEWITPGSTLGTLILILASLGFRLYVQYGSSYSETYGALAGVIVMLLWLYIAALALLVGAEVNSLIELISNPTKDPSKQKG